jgi:hypothetical protein
MEIYSIERSARFSGTEALSLALDIQEMLGVTTLLYDEARIYDTAHKKAATLLFWRSLSCEHRGFYEKRGFRLVDWSFSMQHREYMILVDQKARDILKARTELAEIPFGDFVQVAYGKAIEMCIYKLAGVLKLTPAECVALKVQNVAEGVLDVLRSTTQEALDPVIADIHEVEKSLLEGSRRPKAERRIEEIRQQYVTMAPGQFFIRSGYLPLSPAFPWK